MPEAKICKGRALGDRQDAFGESFICKVKKVALNDRA